MAETIPVQGGGSPTILSPRNSYTVATLPAAAEYTGQIVGCSDGAAGSPCLAYSNGTSWLQIALGSAVSAT